MPAIAVLLALVLAYLVGATPFGFLIARWHGIDIRKVGSGNIGATNVGRLLGKKIGILVFVLDFAKGALPVAVAKLVDGYDWLPITAGLAAFLGHLFPVWLGFRGGKGVATGAGIVAVLMPIPLVSGLLVWLTVVVATRYVSLASVLGAAALVAMHLLLTAEPFGPAHRMLTIFCLIAFGLVLIRHAPNVSRLLRGAENQLPESPAMTILARVLHVLSLGLWFGTGVFFTFIAAVLIFSTLRGLGTMPAAERPAWLPLPATFDESAGTRLAGATVAPLFAPYFVLQGACGLVSIITAFGFTRSEPARRVHRIRFWLLTLAMLTVVAGWPLNQRVSELRVLRNNGDAAAAASFGSWHTVSLFLNFGTVGLVTAGMALAALLPAGTTNGKSETK